MLIVAISSPSLDTLVAQGILASSVLDLKMSIAVVIIRRGNECGKLVEFESFFTYHFELDGSVGAELGVKVEFARTNILKAETIDLVFTVRLIEGTFWQSHN